METQISLCKFKDCSEPSKIRGYCKVHYKRLIQIGVIQKLPLKPPPKCKYKYCDKLSIRGKFLCQEHIDLKKHNLRPLDLNEHPQWKDEDIAWFVGIFEGEGSVSSNSKYWDKIRVASTDKDILEKIVYKLKIGSINGPYQTNQTYKPLYHWICCDKRKLLPLIIRMIPQLCSRRKEKCISVLNKYNLEPPLETKEYSTDEAINWMAGYYDGEGFINKTSYTLGITAMDLDMLEKFQKLVGGGKIYNVKKVKEYYQKMYAYVAWPLKTSEILSKIYPLLCERRKSQIKTIIKNISKGKQENCFKIWPEAVKFIE